MFDIFCYVQFVVITAGDRLLRSTASRPDVEVPEVWLRVPNCALLLRKKLITQGNPPGKCCCKKHELRVRVGQLSATIQTCFSSSLTLHSVCAIRLTGGNASLCQLCASVSVLRGASDMEYHSGQWEDAWEANKSTTYLCFTESSPNQLDYLEGWSLHSLSSITCHKSRSTA